VGFLGWLLWEVWDFFGGGITQPLIGKIYDIKYEKLGDSLAAGSSTLQFVIILTVVLTVAFTYLFLNQRKKKV